MNVRKCGGAEVKNERNKGIEIPNPSFLLLYPWTRLYETSIFASTAMQPCPLP